MFCPYGFYMLVKKHFGSQFMDVKRRDFLRAASTTGLAAVGFAAAEGYARLTEASEAQAQTLTTPAQTKSGEMLYRTLGRTGERVSAIGLGGFHIGKLKTEQESVQLIRRAIDRGINFMDNSWDYHNGRSHRWMGAALKGGYREKVFLMTKIDGRTKAAAKQQIDDSLRDLQVSHIDLVQHHEILRYEDPDRIFGTGGAMEAIGEAQKAGKIRYVGFTGHKHPQIHLRMLEAAAQNNVRFDTVQMPLNVMDAHFRSFEKLVLPELVKNQIGVLGMKSMGDAYILRSNTVSPIECLHYALNLPTSVVITGIDSLEILDQAFEAARTFGPMNTAQVSALLARTHTAAAKGDYERYKTTPQNDSTAMNPAWLG
jgi:predicted aldo/keto reductase-like oxidoreductase